MVSYGTMTSHPKKVTTLLPVRGRIRFAWLMTQWWSRVQWRRSRIVARRHAGSLRRSFMALVGLGLGLLADAFGAGHITKGDLTNFLVATGAMIGGTTAIVFSISLFLLHGVSDMYSSRHLDDYVNHWRDQLIFPAVIAITLGFFASALYVASLNMMSSSLASAIIAASLFLIGIVFGLIDQQYEAVRQKVSPARVIAFLRAKAYGSLRQTERDATQIAEIVRVSSDGMTHNEALAVAYNRVLAPPIADLGRQTELLVDIALRLAERQEVEMARLALVAVGEILAAYLQARRTSSLAFPSAVALLAMESDSHAFLSVRFEQLNRAGITFINAGQDDLAAQVVDVYRVVANAAKDITPLGLTHENPVLEWVMWSLNTYMRSGSSGRNVEVVFHGTGALTEIGIMATDAGLDTLVLAVQERLSEFGTQSLAFSTTVVLNRATSGLLAVLAEAFRGQLVNREFAVERSLQGIGALIVALTEVLGSGAIANDYATSEPLMSGYSQLHAIVVDVVNRYETLTDDEEKRRYRHDLLMLFEALRQHFRQMTQHVKSDSFTAQSLGRLIFHVNEIIIALLARADFADVAENLRECLRWLTYAPYWFLHESSGFDADANAVGTLVDAVAKTGILAWQETQDAVVVGECIRAIDAMAKAAVEKGTGSSGYAQARMFERACYLGILAMKSDWTDVIADLKQRLSEFEEAFVKKYLENVQGLPQGFNPYGHGIAGLPQANQVAVELLHWADRFDYERYNGVRIMERAEDMMYDLTDEAEIRRFIQEMWGSDQRTSN
jgi:hypothetical protein